MGVVMLERDAPGTPRTGDLVPASWRDLTISAATRSWHGCAVLIPMFPVLTLPELSRPYRSRPPDRTIGPSGSR